MGSRSSSTLLRHIRTLASKADAERLSDRELLTRFTAERDEAAFANLVHRHGPMVHAVCHRVLRHAQDAEDVFQATFLVLAQKASALRWQESVGNWLYGVAYRLALKAKVQTARRSAAKETRFFRETGFLSLAGNRNRVQRARPTRRVRNVQIRRHERSLGDTGWQTGVHDRSGIRAVP